MNQSIIDKAIFSSSVFKDEPTLFHGYLPAKLMFREEQMTTIAQNYRPIFLDKGEDNGLTANIAVVGNAGIGKSASVKLIVKDIVQSAKKRGLNIYGDYRNCWINRTRSAILRGILRDKFDVSIRGFGDEEAIDVLIRRLKSNNAYLILILDEVYALLQDEIESFLHLTEEFRAGHRFSIVMISRPSEWNVMISPEISQRISDVIYYQHYDQHQLIEILKYRAGLALKDEAYDDEIIELIAQISLSTNNLRHGLEILHRAGRIADRSNSSEIKPEMIRLAQSSVYPELKAEFLLDLDVHELYVLLGVARKLLEKSQAATSFIDAYESYKLVCDEYEELRKSQQDFTKMIRSLVSIGVLITLDSKNERKISRKRITISDVPASILKERIENQLNQN